jgi:hypothetical protein
MDIEIILESDMTPQHVAEFAVEAEKAGVRTVWHSNITNHLGPLCRPSPGSHGDQQDHARRPGYQSV